jgi:hypothetical protein
MRCPWRRKGREDRDIVSQFSRQIQPTHRRRWIRRTRTVIERREARVVTIGRVLPDRWCQECAAAVPFVSLDVAARVAHQPVPALVGHVAAGEIHVAAGAVEGLTLVCLASVIALVEPR